MAELSTSCSSLKEDDVGEVPEDLVNQSFASEKAAVHFYSSYAAGKGFSVRLDELRKLQNGTIRSRDVVCHRQGQPPEKRQVTLEKALAGKRNNRLSTRCGCQAMIRIVREVTNGEVTNGVEEWIIMVHVKEHNHSLLSAEEVLSLAAFRYITPEDGDRIKLLRRAGIKVSDILNVLRLEKGEALNFNAQDVRNFIRKEAVNYQEATGIHDATELLKILKQKGEKDTSFFYDFTVDEDGRLENILWIPGCAKRIAATFADVVVFDTTYRLNRYHMPFGCFVAVNNHGQSVVLGGTLMRSETSESFQWIFQAWCTGIGRTPDSIMTDQDRAMKDAICTVMPRTKHAFCLWHITQKFSSWFSFKLRDTFGDFMKDFHSIIQVETAQEFGELWFTVMDKYQLGDDKHILDLFQLKEFWCPVFLRRHFFAGMLTTQRSESLNALMDYFMNAQTRLYEFIEAFDRVIVSRLEAVAVADLRDKMGTHRSVTSTKFEEKAFSLLTTYAFKLFKEQLVLSLEYVVEGGYVSHHEHSDKKRTVNWDPETQTIQCSCLYFEFTGILCRHSLRALVHYNVIELSDEYFPRRWCKGAVEMSTSVEGRRISASEADIWKRKFISKAKAVGECGASSPDLRAKLEADLDSMHQYAFGGVADSEEPRKDFPTIRGKRVLVSAAPCSSTLGSSVLVDKTNLTESSVMVENPPICVTKGRPKSNRLQSTVDKVCKVTSRTCRGCGEKVNHDKHNCPVLLAEKKRDTDRKENEALLQYLKRSVSPAGLDAGTLANLIKASGPSTEKGNHKPDSSSNGSSHSGIRRSS
ncbi:hypothetical protein R1sor_019787 [Riccia sorocarpa]|uniref:SWIM-type domain-containing protein n=1 Tax=Riccia sorocarpa TaxID=122646 RepID=A0ABD3IHB4_9MARC